MHLGVVPETSWKSWIESTRAVQEILDFFWFVKTAIHQGIQVPNLEALYFLRLFFGGGFSLTA